MSVCAEKSVWLHKKKLRKLSVEYTGEREIEISIYRNEQLSSTKHKGESIHILYI